MTMHDDQVLMAIFGAWVILFALGWGVVALVRVRKQPRAPSGVPVPLH